MTIWDCLVAFVGIALGIVADEVMQWRRTRRPAPLDYHPRFRPHRECVR